MDRKQTDQIFNAITSNGCREMDEIRFNQAVNECLEIKQMEKQLQKETMKQLSLLDQIKELEEENESIKEELRELQLTEHYRKEAKRQLTDNEEIRQRINDKFKRF